MKKAKIIFQSKESNPYEILSYWLGDISAFKAAGFQVDTIINDIEQNLIYRGSINSAKRVYKNHINFINTLDHLINMAHMTVYLPLIEDLSIETFFVADLNQSTINKIIERGWEKAFIKNEVVSLESIDYNKSIWPTTSFEEMKELFVKLNVEGSYAIRKFIERDIIEKEERYWVLNGNIYHRHNKIPKVVKVAATRLNKLGSRYYTIDATPDFVVEVNPGESSDRHAVNSAELFASWFKKEFA